MYSNIHSNIHITLLLNVFSLPSTPNEKLLGKLVKEKVVHNILHDMVFMYEVMLNHDSYSNESKFEV